MAKLCAMPASLLMTVILIGWPATAAMHFLSQVMRLRRQRDRRAGRGAGTGVGLRLLLLAHPGREPGRVRTSSTSLIFERQRPQNCVHCPGEAPCRVGVKLNVFGWPGAASARKARPAQRTRASRRWTPA